LVERVGLLTLIIMGEGIIGMTNSVSTILQNTNAVNASAIGTIVASILLIYFIWVLYFDQIEHDRFGTIRQQIWALLHFPLHIAILLTVEGSTQFIIWNSIVNNINWLVNNIWPYDYFPANTTTAAYVQSLSDNLTAFDNRFKSKEILDYYNFTLNLTAIGTLNLNDEKDLNESYSILDDLFNGLTTFVFENYNVEVPASDEGQTTDAQKVDALTQIFATVFLYFLIAAGSLLIVLGVMYWFGKSHKSKWEFLSIVVRVLVGIGLALVAISYNYNSGFNLIWSPWMIPMVVLIYLVGMFPAPS
jgi:low temperature requirement protein LtrA